MEVTSKGPVGSSGCPKGATNSRSSFRLWQESHLRESHIYAFIFWCLAVCGQVISQLQFHICRYQTNVTQQLIFSWRRRSVIAVMTRYGLDGPGFECRCWRDFPYPYLTHPPVKRERGLSRGVKRSKRGVDHPAPSGSEVMVVKAIPLLSPPCLHDML